MAEFSLSGLTVLDLTQLVAGPYCTKLMATFGARVVKIEPPGRGDISRQVGPFPQEKLDPEASGLFLYLNASKKGITLDLAAPEGKEVFARLVERADVVVEDSTPGYMASLGLDYDSLASINPRLVMTSLTNFGQTGPYRHYKATEMVLQAMSGLMYFTGEEDRGPLQVGFPLAQYVGGESAFAATLAAVLECNFSGRGQHVDVSIMESLFSSLESTHTIYSYNLEARGRTGSTTGGGWGTFPASDGYVAVVMGGGGEPPTIVRLAELTGIEELKDPKYLSPLARRTYAQEINSMVAPWIRERSMVDIFQAAQAKRLPFGYLCTLKDLLDSEHLKERRFFVELDHSRVGKLPYPGAPFRFDQTSWNLAPAPLLGQHNQEIYGDILGCADEELRKLGERGVI